VGSSVRFALFFARAGRGEGEDPVAPCAHIRWVLNRLLV
jgi:hypothetical protein